jgi:hypothetical protein
LACLSLNDACRLYGGKGGKEAAMDIKLGDTFRSVSDDMEYAVKKIVNGMVVLESPDRKKQILTGVSALKIKSYYLKRENTTS